MCQNQKLKRRRLRRRPQRWSRQNWNLQHVVMKSVNASAGVPRKRHIFHLDLKLLKNNEKWKKNEMWNRDNPPASFPYLCWAQALFAQNKPNIHFMLHILHPFIWSAALNTTFFTFFFHFPLSRSFSFAIWLLVASTNSLLSLLADKIGSNK